MAVPESTFHVFIFLAVGSAIGSFINFDITTRTVMALFSSIMWFLVAFSAYQVRAGCTFCETTYSFESMAFIGYGAGITMAIMFLDKLRDLISDSYRDGEENQLWGGL